MRKLKLLSILALMLLAATGAWAKTLSEVINEAKALVDDNAVAVGKLKAAIATAEAVTTPTDADVTTLQAAIDQFKADNADMEKDETAKVATNGWKKFDGNTADLAPDWAAAAVNTYDGRSTQPAEVYEGSTDGVNRTGTIIYQDITGLTNGKYKVGFYGTAYFTPNRGFDSTMEEGATDVAYVFANEEKSFITAHVGTSFSEYSLLQFDVEVTDGNIKLGLGKDKAGTNWHTMQIYQLTWFTTAKEAYASCQTELAALVTEAKTLAADVNKTEGKDDFNAVVATAEEATTTKADWYNVTEIEAIITGLKKAMADFKKANYTTFNGTYYVQNVATGKFMIAGHDYGTRGIVDGTGFDLNLAANEDKTVVFDTKVFNGDDKHFLGSNLYMDSPTFGWIIEKAGDDVYTISNGTQFIGVDANDNLVLQNDAANWKFVTKENRIAALDAATEGNGIDATFLIQGANFSRGDRRVTASWSVSDDCTNKNLSGGAQTNMCAESFHSTFTISQSITGAPAGIYKMTAQGFYRQDKDEDENEIVETAPVFFANTATAEVPVKTGEENSMSNASTSFSAGTYAIDAIEFSVSDDGKLTVGIKNETAKYQWIIFDNFRLTYYGPSKNVDVEVTAAGYATYCSDIALDFTDKDIKAYTAEASGDKVVLTSINKVAAGTPVVLYYEGGKTESIPFFPGAADDATGNELVRGTGAVVETGTNPVNYILNNVSGVGFYKAAGQTVAKNRAYLPVAAGGGSARMNIVFGDEATGISSVLNAQGTNEIYNLQGQRVKKAQKGLFIQNGKKVIIK